nr:hypothetical protein [Pedobacter sp. ASV19]
MKIILSMILLFYISSAFGQKKVIGPDTDQTWPSLTPPSLSHDGKYVVYSVNDSPKGSWKVILQSTNGLWKKDFKEIGYNDIADDSKYFFYTTGKDTLVRLTLGTNQVKYDYGISSWTLKKYKGSQWICYFKAGNPKTLLLKNIGTDQQLSYSNVDTYEFSEDGNTLLLWKNREGDSDLKSLYWVDVKSGKEEEIWTGKNSEGLLLDTRHQQVVFRQGDSIWLYRPGFKKAKCVSLQIDNGLDLTGIDRFSKDGKRLFLSLKKVNKSKPVKGAMEIWSYKDIKLQSEPRDDGWADYSAVIDLENYKFFNLPGSISYPTAKDAPDTICLMRNESRLGEPWSIARNVTNKLINTRTGEVKDLNFLMGNRQVKMSSSGKYLLYFDAKEGNYFSYEIATGTIRNLTKGIDAAWIDLEWYNGPTCESFPRGLYEAVWLKNDEAVLIYDQYDVWKIDPLNKQKPINVTNEYGKKNGVIFHFAFDEYGKDGIDRNACILLNAFNLNNKDNGYFSIRLNKPEDPTKLFMGPYVIDLKNTGYLPDGVKFNPLKATKSEMYVVRRMSAKEAPNYFSTKDFKTFTRLSDQQPQKTYNWYTTELHTWKSLDGRKLQGILYKPENFDPHKKYPVIFHYYQRKSNGLNAYLQPEILCNGCNINIPTYVSQGYLVFTPDIYYKVGDPMQGSYDAIVSAAKYVSGCLLYTSDAADER